MFIDPILKYLHSFWTLKSEILDLNDVKSIMCR